jgi:hypothetical protein
VNLVLGRQDCEPYDVVFAQIVLAQGSPTPPSMAQSTSATSTPREGSTPLSLSETQPISL